LANSDRDRLAEISAANAAGNTALIYGALEATLGVRLVNLVYRHLATVPGALEWTWAVVSGPFEQNIFAQNSVALVKMASQIPPAVRSSDNANRFVAGLPDQDIKRIVDTIEGYNRANPINALSLNVVALALEDERRASFVPPPETQNTALKELLPLHSIDSLGEETANILSRLAVLTTGKPGPLIPSLYRHFVPWPDFLSRVADWLENLSANGEIDRLSEQVSKRAQEVAAEIYAGLETAPENGDVPGQEIRESLVETIRLFPPAICRMIVIGGLLRHALEGQD